MPDWFKYYQQLAPLIKNLQGGYNGLLPTEDAPIPEEIEVPPVEELKSDYTIQGIPTEERGPGMNNWSPGIYDASSDNVDRGVDIAQKISNNLPIIGKIVSWAGDEIRRTNDAASSRLIAGDYDLRNKYSSQGINTYNDLSNLRYNAFSKKPIQDEFNQFSKNRFRNVLEGAARGYMLGDDVSKDLNKASAAKSMMNGDNNSMNMNSFMSGAFDHLASAGNVFKAATTAIGAMNAIAQNIIGGRKYRSDIGYIDALNNQNKLAYNNALTDANRNINYNLNTSMNKQRQRTYALGGQIDNSEIAGVTTFNAGGTHETNPNGGIPQGIGENGNPNLVEEGEVKWNDFIFSKRIKPQEKILKQYNSSFKGNVASYADAANKILEMHKERENNPFDLATLNVQMQRLADAQEYQKIAEAAEQYGMTPEEYIAHQQQVINGQNPNMFDVGGPLGKRWIQRPFAAKKDAQGAYDEVTGNFKKPLDQVYRGGPTRTTEKAANHLPSQMVDEMIRFIQYYRAYYKTNWQGTIDEQYRPYLSQNTIKRFNDVQNNLNKSAENLSKWFSWCASYDKINGTEYVKLARQYIQGVGRFNDKNGVFNTSYICNKLISTNPNNTNGKYGITNLFTNNITPPRINIIYSTQTEDGKVHQNNIFVPATHAMTTNANGEYTPAVSNTSGQTQKQVKNQPNASTNVSATPSNQTKQTNNTLNRSNIPNTTNTNQTTRVNQVYYIPSLDKYVDAETYRQNPDKYPNAYVIDAKKGNNMVGTVSYANNPEYADKVAKLTSDDWDNIIQELQETNPNRFKNINDPLYYKTGALDGKWGDIHKAVAKYLANQEEPITEQPEESVNTTIPQDNNVTAVETPIDIDINPDVSNEPQQHTKPSIASLLRFAPIANNIRQILEQDAPDYTYANQLKSLYRPEEYRPVGQYQRYQPVDQHYLDTQANQQRNTLYGFYKNNAQSSTTSDFLATMANANTSKAVTQAYLAALQQNNQNRNATIAANNQLDLQNETNRMNVQRANNANYANTMGNAYAAAEQERLAVENAREGNYNNLAENLGNLGRELYDRWRINEDPTYSYDTNWNYQRIVPLANALNELMKERG